MLDIPVSIGCKKTRMLKEVYMNAAFTEPVAGRSVNAKENEYVTYECAGYKVRVHFSGQRTLVQCMKNLAKRTER